jgi:hypothetical protein
LFGHIKGEGDNSNAEAEYSFSFTENPSWAGQQSFARNDKGCVAHEVLASYEISALRTDMKIIFFLRAPA